jgi:hypothetical protein
MESILDSDCTATNWAYDTSILIPSANKTKLGHFMELQIYWKQGLKYWRLEGIKNTLLDVE